MSGPPLPRAPLPAWDRAPFGLAVHRLRASDPGFTRATAAARAILGALAGAAPAALLLAAAGGPPRAAVLGGLVGMMASLTVPPGRERPAHLARLTAAAAVSAATAAALGPWPWIGYAVFVLVIAAAAWVSRTGPAGTALGMVVFMAHSLPLLLRLPPTAAPWLASAVLAGGLGAALVTLVVLPERPAGLLRRALPAFDARLDRLVAAVVVAVATGPDERARERVRRRLAAVQEVALLLDNTLDELAAGRAVPAVEALRDEILWVEVLADHLAWSVVARPDGPPSPGEAARLAAAWRPSTSDAADPEPGAIVPEAAGPAMTSEVLARFVAARVATRRERLPRGFTRALRAAPPAPAEARRPPLPVPPAPRGRVVQASLAGALAIALGLLLSPIYWQWAVMGAFVVVLTTPYRGAALRRAVDRTLGTAVGVVAGLALGTLLSGRSSVELVAIVWLVFAAFWVLRVSYVWMTLLMTVMVALLYDVMGQLSAELLATRLHETALGAAIGGLVAWFVLPCPTRSAIDVALVGVLDALDALLVAIADPAAPLFDRIRALDRAVASVRTLTEPLVTSVPVPVAADVRAARFLATSTRFRARALATAMRRNGATGLAALFGPAPLVIDAPTAEVLAAVRRRLHDLRARLDPAGTPIPDLPEGDLAAGEGPVADILRGIDARLVGYLEARRMRAA